MGGRTWPPSQQQGGNSGHPGLDPLSVGPERVGACMWRGWKRMYVCARMYIDCGMYAASFYLF